LQPARELPVPPQLDAFLGRPDLALSALSLAENLKWGRYADELQVIHEEMVGWDARSKLTVL
jgi:hypothetical protein